MKYLTILIFGILFLISCRNRDNDTIKFYGETITVAYPKQVDTLHNSKILELEGEYTGDFDAYDGVLMFRSEKHPNGYTYLYDAETGKRKNAICPFGQGPEEVLYYVFEDNFEKDSNGIHFWISDVNKKRLLKINMQGQFTQIINTSNFKSTNSFGIGEFFMVNDSVLLAYVQPGEIFTDGQKCYSPSYHVFNYKTNKILRTYEFYSDYTVDEGAGINPDMYLYSIDRIKPDKSKIAMAMWHLNRINILDLKSGKIKSIGTKDAPDLNLASSGKRVKPYYRGLRCDEHYIYAIESTLVERNKNNASFWYENLTKPSGRIHVFDWDGNFTNILQVKEDVAVNFAFDPVHKKLYSKTDTEKVTAYDLNFLYK